MIIVHNSFTTGRQQLTHLKKSLLGLSWQFLFIRIIRSWFLLVQISSVINETVEVLNILTILAVSFLWVPGILLSLPRELWNEVQISLGSEGFLSLYPGTPAFLEATYWSKKGNSDCFFSIRPPQLTLCCCY